MTPKQPKFHYLVTCYSVIGRREYWIRKQNLIAFIESFENCPYTDCIGIQKKIGSTPSKRGKK